MDRHLKDGTCKEKTRIEINAGLYRLAEVGIQLEIAANDYFLSINTSGPTISN